MKRTFVFLFIIGSIFINTSIVCANNSSIKNK